MTNLAHSASLAAVFEDPAAKRRDYDACSRPRFCVMIDIGFGKSPNRLIFSRSGGGDPRAIERRTILAILLPHRRGGSPGQKVQTAGTVRPAPMPKRQVLASRRSRLPAGIITSSRCALFFMARATTDHRSRKTA